MTETRVDSLARSLLQSIGPTAHSSTSRLNSLTRSNHSPLEIPEKSHTGKEMVPLVREASGPTAINLILELVHMIDTGGQPELMEVMPTLMQTLL